MSNLADNRQLDRLKYIDLCAYVLGFINRKNLMNRFNISVASASKDIALYQESANSRLQYSNTKKGYIPVDWFAPFYEHETKNALNLIGFGKQEVICEPNLAKNMLTYEIEGAKPELTKIYELLRAIYHTRKVEIVYSSRTSGKTKRVIVPHSFIKTGTHTYVRAFDHRSGEFRSFKLNRIFESRELKHSPDSGQNQIDDVQWNHEIEVTIVVHPKIKHKETIEGDFGLVNGELKIKLREASLPYFLMDWNIVPLEYHDLPCVLFPLVVSKIDNKKASSK